MNLRQWIAGAAGIAVLLYGWSAIAEPLVLSAGPVPLDVSDQARDRVGRLLYLGGLRLASADSRFGGISGLAISPDGKTLTMITDRGDWLRVGPVYGDGGRLSGIRAASIGRLIGADGRPLRKKKRSDAESLEPVDGGFAVAFEHRHRILLYPAGPDPFSSTPRKIDAPRGLRKAPSNGAIEALARLVDGRIVAIAEDYPQDSGQLFGWISKRLDRKPRWRRFSVRRTALFHATGATVLPSGELLLLERRFTFLGGYATRLSVIRPADIRPGATVSGVELARLGPPLVEENFEGVAARRDDTGRTLIYLVSDDNFHPLQSTILLLFALAP